MVLPKAVSRSSMKPLKANRKDNQEANTGYRRDSGQGRNQNEAGFRQLPSQHQPRRMRRQLQQLILRTQGGVSDR